MKELTLDLDHSGVADPVFRAALYQGPRLEPPLLSDRARHVAIRTWTDRARSEYVGVMIVRKLHGLLVDLTAPRDVQELALRMLLDEQRHAGACAAAVEALGGAPSVVFDLDELRQERSTEPLEAQLIELLVGTYACGEVVAHALLRHAVRALPPSGFRDVLRHIARDEVLHARFGPALLAAARSGSTDAWLPWPGEGVVRGLVERQRAWMATRDVVEPTDAQLFEDPVDRDSLLAVGVTAPGPFRIAYLRAVSRLREP